MADILFSESGRDVEACSLLLEAVGLQLQPTCRSLGQGGFSRYVTLPKFNMEPENGWLEDEFSFGIPYFQGLC